jgi:hypothetical protein
LSISDDQSLPPILGQNYLPLDALAIATTLACFSFAPKTKTEDPSAEMMGTKEIPKRQDLVDYNYAVAGQ